MHTTESGRHRQILVLFLREEKPQDEAVNAQFYSTKRKVFTD